MSWNRFDWLNFGVTVIKVIFNALKESAKGGINGAKSSLQQSKLERDSRDVQNLLSLPASSADKE